MHLDQEIGSGWKRGVGSGEFAFEMESKWTVADEKGTVSEGRPKITVMMHYNN